MRYLAKIFLLVAVACQLSFSLAAAEEELDSSRKNLEQIQKQIEETIRGLRGKQIESGALAEDLERLSSEVRRIERLEKKSNRQLSELSDKLEEKRKILSTLEGEMKTIEGQVKERLVVLYKTGDVGLLRALLSSSESPRDITEKYAFLSRMVRHDRELLEKYRQQSLEHRKGVSELEALRKKQSNVVLRRRTEQETLSKARRSKKRLLAAMKEDEHLLGAMLKELRAKAARLNDLVKKLETEETQTYTEKLVGLEGQKGRLIWPVNGKLKVGFGTSRHGELGTLIESHGFDIEAAIDTPVTAVAAGKVIFAKVLRGYGRLMIIDHGQKYYTLYAHLLRVDKKVGDHAAAGDVIGSSGYEGRDAVYFEVRKGGKPLDPADWLKKR
jgi:septal ring factor EnvC (AmiA/AmiB activator)